MYRCLDCLNRNESYDAILDQKVASDGKIDPRAYISLGSVILWAGKRPRLFRRLLKRARLSTDLRSVSALVWTAWAYLSPGTLRPFLLFLLSARNAFAKTWSKESAPVLWSQPRPLPIGVRRTIEAASARSA